MKSSHRFPTFFAIIVVLCGCQSARRGASALTPATAGLSSTNPVNTAESAGSHDVPEPLSALNALFLDAYKQRQAFVKTNTSPVIVADFSSLILYRNGVTETNRSIPDVYQALKAVAHVPFGIYLRLVGYANESPTLLPEPVIEKLTVCQADIAEAESALQGANFSATQLARQRAILEECQSYLTNVLTTRVATRTELLAFARKVSPWLLKNAADAAAAQLDMTHSAVMGWKRKLSSEEWRRLVVVVRGPQMPRRLNILTQYFAKVIDESPHQLGYPLESRRLIYAEFIFQSRDHLDLMATTFVDGEASEAFFGDHWRMSRDLLADGAQAYLKKLKFD